MGLALPVQLIISNETDIRLVYEGGRLEGVVGAFLSHVPHRDLVEFSVEMLEQFGSGLGVSPSGAARKLPDPLLRSSCSGLSNHDLLIG